MSKAKTSFRQPIKTNPVTSDALGESILKGIPKEIAKPVYRDESYDDVIVKRKTLDPLTEQLGMKSYIYKARFQWLKQMVGGRAYSLDVERYYEDLKLCLDINIDKNEQTYVNMKKELCEKNGMQYFYLKSVEDVENMLASLRSH